MIVFYRKVTKKNAFIRTAEECFSTQWGVIFFIHTYFIIAVCQREIKRTSEHFFSGNTFRSVKACLFAVTWKIYVGTGKLHTYILIFLLQTLCLNRKELLLFLQIGMRIINSEVMRASFLSFLKIVLTFVLQSCS